MDILRKELNDIYFSQCLDEEQLDSATVEKCRNMAQCCVDVSGACLVITDASCDRCYLFTGRLNELVGLPADINLCQVVNSSDEDIIYDRIHPEDLVEKRMLEYEYFKFVDKLSAEHKIRYKAVCRIRMRKDDGQYLVIDNSVRILRTSPAGKIWLILCSYDLSPWQDTENGIDPRIVNNITGEIISLSLSGKRDRILTEREKEILELIKEGRLSKQIAGTLGISVNTVNRHRQNIISKLCVSNSVEAVVAATAMKLL